MTKQELTNRGTGVAKWSFPPVHPEGRKFGLIAAAVTAILAFMELALQRHGCKTPRAVCARQIGIGFVFHLRGYFRGNPSFQGVWGQLFSGGRPGSL
jgi:hypothetical protein